MILLVPVYPEVPKRQRPKLWPGLVLLIVLALTYIEAHPTLDADTQYIESIQSIIMDGDGSKKLKSDAQTYLQLRPLLRIAPAPADWDLRRLLFANFIHGSEIHLFLNMIGAFAAARICTTFMPFLCTMSIFIVGGSIGLFASLLLSFEISGFIPHVGASAGIFAMLGAYYVYNFRYRTKYFFWFPLRRGLVALRTSWFFFFDVILLEVLFSTTQFFPNRLDNVDHIAHVVGFMSGVGLAFLLRAFQRWPAFLQTRAEFLYWTNLRKPGDYHPVYTPLMTWIELLEINPYNDRVKSKVIRMITLLSDKLSDEHIARVLNFISPTFVRLHAEDVAYAVRELVARNRPLPKKWLSSVPYDSVIRIAKEMTQPPEEQVYLYRFIMEYQKAHSKDDALLRKLELLVQKLDGLMLENGVAKTPPPLNPPAAENTSGIELEKVSAQKK
jgi:membrane associated rhomboid family serine protease